MPGMDGARDRILQQYRLCVVGSYHWSLAPLIDLGRFVFFYNKNDLAVQCPRGARDHGRSIDARLFRRFNWAPGFGYCARSCGWDVTASVGYNMYAFRRCRFGRYDGVKRPAPERPCR